MTRAKIMVECSKRRDLILQLTLSIALATSFFLLWPTSLIWDDGGIILKYMDNFADGYFYSYNPTDGAVFGISSFVHGVLAGFFAYTHLFSPLNSVFASNYIGLVLVSFVSFRLLSLYSSSRSTMYGAWLLLMISSPSFVTNVKQGLEPPLHLSIILCCFLLFLRDKGPWMWFFLVLAVISKLDALSVAVVVALTFFAKKRVWSSPALMKTTLRNAFLFGVVPGVAWLIFAYLMFGSPVPLPAVAKLYYHGHPSGVRLAFLAGFGLPTPIILLTLLLVVSYVVHVLVSKQYNGSEKVLPYAFSILAYLGLYCYWNPEEKMIWYYAVPEFLILLQGIVVFLILIDKLPAQAKLPLSFCAFAFVALVSVPAVWGGGRRCIDYLRQVETERIAVGEWIRQNANPADTLFAWHGHIARNSQLYTTDISGLNSKITVKYKRNVPKMIEDMRPNWIAGHHILVPWIQAAYGYRLRKSYYNIAGLYGWPSWRIFERAPEEERFVAVPPDISMVKVVGGAEDIREQWNYLTIRAEKVIIEGFETADRVSAFIVGLVKQKERLSIVASVYDRQLELCQEEHLRLDPYDERDPLNGYTEELRIDIDPNRGIGSIVVEGRDENREFPRETKMVDPLFLCPGSEFRGERIGARGSARRAERIEGVVIVTDDEFATEDLSSSEDVDNSGERKLVIRWSFPESDYKDFHVYVRDLGSDYRYLGRTGTGEASSLVWVEGGSGICAEFWFGPVFGESYRFEVYGITVSGAPPYRGPVETAGAVRLLPSVTVSDNMTALDDVSNGQDMDPADSRELIVRWHFNKAGMDLSDVSDFHIYVKTDHTSGYKYLGRPGNGQAEYFEWKTGVRLLSGDYINGPEFGRTYQFRVYALTKSGSPKAFGPFENAGPVRYNEASR